MNKAATFKELHYSGKILVLPNVWDPLGAMVLENLGYKAIATASASIALTNGYRDGENIPFGEVVAVHKRIVNSVSIPVTADIESGYESTNSTLKENIKRLLDTGIAGINFEDSKKDKPELVNINEQCEKISLIKEVVGQNGSGLFINARTDVYLKGGNGPEEEKFEEIIRRGNAYKTAGADGFYPMILRDKEKIKRIIEEVNLPINLLLISGLPDFEELQKMNLARLSLGPGFL
jgi:2-methylisocitrate lyase-like PEP mutase family enzyme